MNSGGRRRPHGLLLRRLAGCALVIAVLGLWLGTAAGSSPTSTSTLASVSHIVSMSHVSARPPAPDPQTATVELMLLAVAAVGVLVATRRVSRPVRIRSEQRRGRAPPGLR